MTRPRLRLQNLLHQSRGSLRSVFSPARLQLAGKAALAAGIAWAVAPLIPGPASTYAYYAPFGALISMYPTVSSSLRQGLQSLVGLAFGIALAFCLVALGKPTPVSVAVVIGAGILLAGIPRIGGGKDWIPMAALFVLVIGGSNAETFSIGYLLQTGVGIAVGLTVNVLVFPPLHFNAAAASLEDLRLQLATQLEDMAAAVTEPWPPDHEDWSRRSGTLSQATGEVREAVIEADLSRRANPRRRAHPRDIEADYQHVAALESVAFHIRDITEVLSTAIWEEHQGTPMPPELCPSVSAALEAAGGLVRHWTSGHAGEYLEKSRNAVDVAAEEYHRLAAGGTPITSAASITMSLARIVRLVDANPAVEP